MSNLKALREGYFSDIVFFFYVLYPIVMLYLPFGFVSSKQWFGSWWEVKIDTSCPNSIKARAIFTTKRSAPPFYYLFTCCKWGWVQCVGRWRRISIKSRMKDIKTLTDAQIKVHQSYTHFSFSWTLVLGWMRTPIASWQASPLTVSHFWEVEKGEKRQKKDSKM